MKRWLSWKLIEINNFFVDMNICKCSLADKDDSSFYWLLDVIFENAEITQFDSFLDIGCGKGRVLSYFVKNGFACKITGVEKDKQLFELARSWGEKYKNLSIINTDIFDLPLDSFNVFYYFNLLNKPDFERFIKKIEKEILHPITIYACNDIFFDMLEHRPGWTKHKQYKTRDLKNIISICNIRNSVWGYNPQ